MDKNKEANFWQSVPFHQIYLTELKLSFFDELSRVICFQDAEFIRIGDVIWTKVAAENTCYRKLCKNENLSSVPESDS